MDRHWKAIQCSYARAKYFEAYAGQIRRIYESCRGEEYLSKVNYQFLKGICEILGICTKLTWSSDYILADGKTQRLVSLVQSAGGDAYLSGPAAKDYIEPELFVQAGICLEWMDYSGYPQYRQLSSSFMHEVSILDLIFNEGPKAPCFMKSFG